MTSAEACGICGVNAVYMSGALFWWLAGSTVTSLFLLHLGRIIFTKVIPNPKLARKMDVASLLVFGFLVTFMPVFFIIMVYNLTKSVP